jgi:peroxiredoxin
MTNLIKKLTGAAAIFAGIGLVASPAFAGSQANLDGRWAATVTQAGIVIPFRLDIATAGGKVVATLYNGDDKETTTGATIGDGKVELDFQHYLTSIKAEIKEGELDGVIETAHHIRLTAQSGDGEGASADSAKSSKTGYNAEPARTSGGNAFHAKRYVASAATEAKNVPSIDGVWEIPNESPKGEKAWRLIVKQNGADISTSVLRVDGDTGALTGSWRDGKFVASHFDGSRPGLIELTPQPDGSLSVILYAPPRVGTMVAYRPEVARAKGLPEPANFLTHTSVRDPNEAFAFNFPDTNGKIQANDDARYKGKVVVAVVTGTWCPNCHDEAQYLVELYAKYHDRGLEIVALDFEDPEQQTSLERVNAFIKQYHVPYSYLIAGTPEEMWDKVPQLVNLNTWPATVFVGRDGRVKAIHSGFAGPASGIYHAELVQEFTSTIERLLDDRIATDTVGGQ